MSETQQLEFERRLRKQAERLGITVEELREKIHNSVRELLLLEEECFPPEDEEDTSV